MGVDAVPAIGKFSHIGAADNDGTGRPQARDRRGVRSGRWCVTQNGGAGAGSVTLNIK